MIPPRARRAHTRAEFNSIQLSKDLSPATYVAREDDGLWITPSSPPVLPCECHDHRVFGHASTCRLGPPLSWRNTITGLPPRPVRQYRPAPPVASQPPLFRRFPTLGGTP